MAISVLNSAGSAVTLKSTTDSGDEVPHHIIDSVTGAVVLGTGTNSIGKLGTSNDGVDIGDVDVASVALPTALKQFLVTIAATEAVMATHTLKSGVTLKADAANTGSVFVGPTGVTTANGHPLAAGDTLFLELSNTNLLYTIGTASDKLWVIGS